MDLKRFILVLMCVSFSSLGRSQAWQSQFVEIGQDQKLIYHPDAEGNTIPDFSMVGYGSGEGEIPNVKVVEEIEPVDGDNRENIQNAINRVAAYALGSDGFRGAVLLKKGIYEVNGSIFITQSGIVIRGEGTGPSGTVVRETSTSQTDLFCFKGKGNNSRMTTTKIAIDESFVPTGRKYVVLADASSFHAGDSVLVFRPGTDNWIQDLKMDQIEEREGTRQWEASEYNLYYERIITHIKGNQVYLDNPVVMQIDKKYGGGYLMKYSFDGRVKNCGIENILLESTYQSDTDEEHGWNAVSFSKVDQGWAREVIAKYFGYSCVTIDENSRNISVLDCQCLEAKSVITGGRRYSFNCNGQLNLFKNCYTTEGRHDYVTGARVCGPNVFTQCKARNTHADIGPHHRWASGTLFDQIDTDGEINVQDRGNWGSGHGWAGVTQVVWNCKVSSSVIQSPWVSGKNYSIGLIGGKYDGRLSGRPDGEWEGQNREGLVPASLYEAQLKSKMLATDLSETSSLQNIKVYPNPVKGEIKVSYQGKCTSYSFYSMNGTKVKSGKVDENPFSFKVENLDKGIYLLECQLESKTYAQKIIIP